MENDCQWIWVSFWGDENSLILIVVRLHNSVNTLKITEFDINSDDNLSADHQISDITITTDMQ